MNRLPSETLLEIFDRLVFQDKLQCTLTCRDWHAMISSTVLYSKITFKYPQSHIKTETYIKHILDKKLRHQVRDLKANNFDDPLALSELFPNLKLLQVENWEYNNWNDCNNAFLAKNWKMLEVINETGYILTMSMMSLSSLTLSLYRQDKIKQLELFKLLKNAPVLEHLILARTWNLNPNMLDLLHENTPRLKNLELKDVEYDIIEGEDDDLKEYRPLSILYVSRNLRSFSLTFKMS
jgi:hypothetical protein